MSAAEHSNVLHLLSSHQEITRKVEEIPGGVRTTTTTTEPELVETLRAHVRQMSRHVKQGQPVRMWDPVFRDIFAHYDEIALVAKDIKDGIEVTETSENSELVPLIRAHAKKIDGFVAEGHAATCPPEAVATLRVGPGEDGVDGPALTVRDRASCATRFAGCPRRVGPRSPRQRPRSARGQRASQCNAPG
jgi:hypothetical protein